jgi:nitrate/nitrite transporter NarK
LVFGVFGVGFDDGGVGISGAELGIDGDAGGGGVCVVQATMVALVAALSAIAARVDLVRFMLALLYNGLISWRGFPRRQRSLESSSSELPVSARWHWRML